MPKDIKLVNDGFKCPKATRKGKTYMQVCCKKDPKYKVKVKKTKFFTRRYGDLSFTYDVLQAYGNNYLAQVTIDNTNKLGRLDHWNLTWEWMNGEFIYSMRGAYTRSRNYANCLYGPAGKYYADLDFSEVMSCDKKPVISDLPKERANDSKVGKLPYCCRNGSLLPAYMDESRARSIFQMQVYKLPPNMNRTALEPPQHWKIEGVVNPHYKCGAPIRVDPTEFPDSSGLQSYSTAIASWQVVCNIARPKAQQTRCCVSFSAYYNESVIPCNTCACGCEDNTRCSEKANSMLLPAEALLVPFENRTAKALAWAHMKKFKVPNPRPCPDNCPVSINWHINADYKSGWTARITLFNWDSTPFEDWFAAIQMGKAFPGYENVYSFNGSKIDNKTIFFQGLPGLNFLVAEVNGTRKGDPRVPGKQQSKVFFNGEECALPTRIPIKGGAHKLGFKFSTIIFSAILAFLLVKDHLH
ncbi:hypothetical protein K2173_003151 [Erythroxylum novogranatense]|uniref:COBRA-like protein n=1 Tax=Erythroxylum novogranatense TaxID=1862640 RepID=A0AAV8TCF6_9ROSI|nr:hypothetical protein K2173_003151 [Erythroxylum novogranatense]